jgi:hypothetical protein
MSDKKRSETAADRVGSGWENITISTLFYTEQEIEDAIKQRRSQSSSINSAADRSLLGLSAR